MNRWKSSFRVEPMTWSAWETGLMRLGFALVILLSGIIWNAAQLPDPNLALEDLNGIAKVLPLRWLANPSVLMVGKPLVAAGLILYVVGLAPGLTLFPALLFMVGTGALRNSMGDITHHTQIVAMVLLAQWLVYVIFAARRKGWWTTAADVQQRVIFYSILVLAASYFASGLVKLKASDFQWIEKVPALSVQIIKAVWSESYSTGVPVSGFKAETAPFWIAHHPQLARVIFGSGLLLELLGVLLVMSRRHARVIGVALIGMHMGISVLMDIEFWNHLLLVLIFAVNVPGWVNDLRRTHADSASG